MVFGEFPAQPPHDVHQFPCVSKAALDGFAKRRLITKALADLEAALQSCKRLAKLMQLVPPDSSSHRGLHITADHARTARMAVPAASTAVSGAQRTSPIRYPEPRTVSIMAAPGAPSSDAPPSLRRR